MNCKLLCPGLLQCRLLSLDEWMPVEAEEKLY
jgi:hypothetical protein